MAQLNSPGVVVTVVDESFYTPAAPSTVPCIVVATAENKPNGANTGIAPGTLKSNAGLAYLITSQRDLSETFGVPIFRTDSNNNPVHAGEQNEYGLQAAYSLLGVSNRAYVVRADVDLGALDPQALAPQAEPEAGTYWFDVVKSSWGIFEWNGDVKGVGRGQTFTKKVPTIVTDPAKVDSITGAPKASVGTVGDYAVVSLMNLATSYSGADVMWYRNSTEWVKVGSDDWRISWPAAISTKSTINIPIGDDDLSIEIDGVSGFDPLTETITLPTGTVSASTIASAINTWSPGPQPLVEARVNSSGRLELYSRTGSFTIGGAAAQHIGINAGTYNSPKLEVAPHTRVPLFKTGDPAPRPTGSVWIKTTTANGGAEFALKKYNADSDIFESITAPMYPNAAEAIYALDKTGGERLPVGSVYVKTNQTEYLYTYPTSDKGPLSADFKFYRKNTMGATTITSKKIENATLAPNILDLVFQETKAGMAGYGSPVTVTVEVYGVASDAEDIAKAINDQTDLVNVRAQVDSQNRLVIQHLLGGDIRIEESSVSAEKLITILFSGQKNAQLHASDFDDSTASFQPQWEVSHWDALRFTASTDAPTTLTLDQTLWYNSVVDEVDIMVHDGQKWRGYKEIFPLTDDNGPQVAATRPLTQSTGSPLVDGDLWIDTSDIDNYPMIYRFDTSRPGTTFTKWVLLDKTDQSSEDGVLFADARWTDIGVGATYGSSTIQELLQSSFVDPDCPDPALYPKGMLLWNMRRSGFNVKKFVQNYIDVNEVNTRYEVLGISGFMIDESMTDYYPHRWVTISGNQENGAGYFGRHAQRRVVVQSLQAVTNSSRDIREEARVFNLLSCPGYPELIGELINLNFDRGLTAFIVGDTPARLTPDATSLKAWGDNLRLSVEDNEQGAPSYDEYMGMFYPWGFTSDLSGRNIVVPPSHMMLRTIALSDSVSYPWFAPAGTRRGGITNASNVGYIDDEGEFVVVALNTGQRDTLYDVKINPITFFTGAGLVNYGQKTRAKNASALDRINVARLVIYLRRQLDILAKPYVFEPNDKITRDEIKGAVESLLLELVGQRALYDYIVVCDESNNTPARIDRNELYVDVAIEPVKAVEFIYIPLRLKNTGEIAGL
jgi:hypothetical protein